MAAYHQGSAKDGLTASRKDTVEPVAAARAGTPFAISEDSVSEGSVHPVLLQKLPAAPPKKSMSVPPSMQRRQSVMSQGMNPARQRWNTAIQAVSTMLGLLGVTKQSTSNFARLVTIKLPEKPRGNYAVGGSSHANAEASARAPPTPRP